MIVGWSGWLGEQLYEFMFESFHDDIAGMGSNPYEVVKEALEETLSSQKSYFWLWIPNDDAKSKMLSFS